MSREFLASRVLSGNSEVPEKTRWWPKHSKEMAKFLFLSSSTNEKSKKEAREVLVQGGREWDETVLGFKHGPMVEHAKLEASLIEQAMKLDLVTVERLGEELSENAREIASQLSMKLAEAPREQVRRLLNDHVIRFIESVRFYMDADEKAYSKSEIRRSENTLALATFATEWS